MLKALSLTRSALLSKKQPVFTILRDPVIDFDFLLSPQYEKNVKHRKSVDTELSKLKSLYENFNQDSETQKNLLYKTAMKLPNLSHKKTPIGDESQAKLISEHGEKKVFNGFRSLPAVNLLTKLKLLRVKNLAYSNGDRTYIFHDRLARLERALIRYTTDQLIKSGFQLVSVPDTFNSEIIEACGFSTQGDRHQVYKIEDLYSKDSTFQHHCLSGTSEIALGGLCAYRSFPTDHLPVRLCAVSRCYRREVPQHEPELYRVNQFSKVEMFCVASGTQESSDAMFEEILDIQKSIYSSLDLHFRVLEMPAEELGLPAHRKVDIEAWMPGENRYGEISSASNCTDFQSRRLHITEKINESSQESKQFVHTLNGTACAVPRIIKALVETHQDENGQVNIPPILWPYMNGSKNLVKEYPPIKMTYIDKLYDSVKDSVYF